MEKQHSILDIDIDIDGNNSIPIKLPSRTFMKIDKLISKTNMEKRVKTKEEQDMKI